MTEEINLTERNLGESEFSQEFIDKCNQMQKDRDDFMEQLEANTKRRERIEDAMIDAMFAPHIAAAQKREEYKALSFWQKIKHWWNS